MTHKIVVSCLAAGLVAACATTDSSYPYSDTAEKTAADVAVHLDQLSNTQVVDCLDINTVMGALLLNNTQDLGIPQNIMLEIQGLNLLAWIAARDRRVTDDLSKDEIMQSGTFQAKFDALEEEAARTFLNEERIK